MAFGKSAVGNREKFKTSLTHEPLIKEWITQELEMERKAVFNEDLKQLYWMN
jgi:hypothetical protein